MIKDLRAGKLFCVLAMLISLLMISDVDNKKIFADVTWNSVDTSKWTKSGTSGDISITGYNGPPGGVVIPNANDFGVDKVKITKAGMQSIATTSGVTGIKISDTGTADDDKKKVFADGDDWKETFRGCDSLTILDLSGFDTSAVKNMNHMFQGCKGLVDLDLSSLNTSNTTSMQGMFEGCESLRTLDLSSFDTGKVGDMYGMFLNCKKLENVILDANTYQNNPDIGYMFSGCGSFKTLDSVKLKVTFDTRMKNMFKGASNLIAFDFGDEFVFNNTNNSDTESNIVSAFADCPKLIIANLSKVTLKANCEMTDLFKVDETAPLLVITNDQQLKDYDYAGDNRTKLSITLEVDGDKIKFKDGTGNVTNETSKVINVYDTFTTTDDYKTIINKLIEKIRSLRDKDSQLSVAEGYEYELQVENLDDEVGTISEIGKNSEGVTTLNEIISWLEGREVTASEVSALFSASYILKPKAKSNQPQFQASQDPTNPNTGDSTGQTSTGSTTGQTSTGSTTGQTSTGSTTGQTSTGSTNGQTEERGNYYGYGWSAINSSGDGSSTSFSSSSFSDSSSETKSKSSQDKINSKTGKILRSIELPESLKTIKYLTGYEDGSIKPSNNLTRAEFVAIIYNLMASNEHTNYDNLSSLSDVEKSDWFAPGVSYLLDKNIISLVDNKFNPNENVTRGEVAQVLFNIFKFYGSKSGENMSFAYGDFNYNFVDANGFGEFGEAIKQLASNGIINGYENNKFEPNKDITRGELAKVIFTAFQRKYNPSQKIYNDLKETNWAYKFLMDASE